MSTAADPVPAGLRDHLVKSLAAALQEGTAQSAQGDTLKQSAQGDTLRVSPWSAEATSSAQLLVAALAELTAASSGADGRRVAGVDEKGRNKALAQAVRRRGESIIRRVRRDAGLRARMLAVQPGHAAELLHAAEDAAAKAKQAGETITSQHAQLRVARRSGDSSSSVDGDALARYADSMAALAQDHWAPDEQTRGGCRIEWCVETAREFFREHKDTEVPRQSGRGTKRPAPDSAAERSLGNAMKGETVKGNRRRLKLLDVGSCYDPFRRFKDLDVTAFDLCPAPAAAPTVFTGNILSLDVVPSNISGKPAESSEPETPGAQLAALPQESFDCVTLCLVLSYIPDAVERTRAVWTARRLLRPRGLLLIVTPHSTNRLTNAVSLPIFSEWRTALAELGFEHHKYTRLARHHALAFSTTEVSGTNLRCAMPTKPLQPMRIAFDLRGNRKQHDVDDTNKPYQDQGSR